MALFSFPYCESHKRQPFASEYAGKLNLDFADKEFALQAKKMVSWLKSKKPG
jgi:hypothetical protein